MIIVHLIAKNYGQNSALSYQTKFTKKRPPTKKTRYVLYAYAAPCARARACMHARMRSLANMTYMLRSL